MSIFVEVIDDRLEVSYGGHSYRTNLATLICDAANEPYRRGEARRWFAGTHRPTLEHVNWRPC